MKNTNKQYKANGPTAYNKYQAEHLINSHFVDFHHSKVLW